MKIEITEGGLEYITEVRLEDHSEHRGIFRLTVKTKDEYVDLTYDGNNVEAVTLHGHPLKHHFRLNDWDHITRAKFDLVAESEDEKNALWPRMEVYTKSVGYDHSAMLFSIYPDDQPGTLLERTEVDSDD